MSITNIMDGLGRSTSMSRLGAVLMVIVLYPIFESGNSVRIIELLQGVTLGFILSIMYYCMFERSHDE